LHQNPVDVLPQQPDRTDALSSSNGPRLLLVPLSRRTRRLPLTGEDEVEPPHRYRPEKTKMSRRIAAGRGGAESSEMALI
jgi:hypothetical protein